MKNETKNRVRKLVESCSTKLENLANFERENSKVLKRHLQLQEMAQRSMFKTSNILEMLLEEGKIDEQVSIVGKYIICKVDSEKKLVRLWEAKKFKK